MDLLLYSGNSQGRSTTSRMSTYYCTWVIHRDDIRHPGCGPIIVLDTASSASFLDLYLEFYDSGQLSNKIDDKRDDFNFKIINVLNMCSNISPSPAYGVYISQLIHYARASSKYSVFLKRHLYLRNRLLDQGYKKIRLFRSLKKFIFRYHDLVEKYSVSAEMIINDGFS